MEQENNNLVNLEQERQKRFDVKDFLRMMFGIPHVQVTMMYIDGSGELQEITEFLEPQKPEGKLLQFPGHSRPPNT